MFRLLCATLRLSPASRASRPANVTDADILAAYRILGLAARSSPDAVRNRYLALARKYHPDVNEGDEGTMKSVNQAYEVVQLYGKTLPSDHAGVGEAQNAARKDTADVQPRDRWKWRRRTSSWADAGAVAWHQKSDLDWTAAMHDVTDEERADPRTHPWSPNRTFSMEEDSQLYEMVRSGSTTLQVATTLGKTPLDVERRLNQAQFKRRIQVLLGRRPTKANGQRSLAGRIQNARKPITVNRESDDSVVDELGFSREDAERAEWSRAT